MKVLHINYSDSKGGAAIAAYRHHEAMRRVGIDSKMLVIDKHTNDKNVIQYKEGLLMPFVKTFVKILLKIHRGFASWSLNTFSNDLSDEEVVVDADIIYLHWVNGCTISTKSIEKILKTGKTVYWFMHDMWPITGGCHHSFECNKYKSHCGKCPLTRKRKGSCITRDISYWQFEEKIKRMKPYKNLHVLTPSKWLADCVKQSALLGDHEVSVCRNLLDTNSFKQRNKQEARKRLGLPEKVKLVLFGADNINNPYKGWQYLRDALIEPIDGVECVLYGACTIDVQSQVGIKVNKLGHISEINKLIDLYSACDVFVTPSLADNYPNVLIEAMACGLPAVGFTTGGIPEIVRNGVTGITISPDSNLLREKIMMISSTDDFDRFSTLAIEQIKNENSYETVLVNHNELQQYKND
jgi:glycosyltransferase involved in cell wall biosynthesis